MILNFKCPQAAWTWQTFRFTVSIGHRLCLPHFFFQLVSLTAVSYYLLSHWVYLKENVSSLFLYLPICDYMMYIYRAKDIKWVDVMNHNTVSPSQYSFVWNYLGMRQILFLYCPCKKLIQCNSVDWKAQNVYFQFDPVITVLSKMEKCANEIIWLLHAFLFIVDKVIASQIFAD